jgi:hypothetical protein
MWLLVAVAGVVRIIGIIGIIKGFGAVRIESVVTTGIVAIGVIVWAFEWSVRTIVIHCLSPYGSVSLVSLWLGFRYFLDQLVDVELSGVKVAFSALWTPSSRHKSKK